MQLHPSELEESIKHTFTSLNAGIIDLDFAHDIGDLNRLNKNDLPSGQHDCREFAHIMKKDDIILVIAHHFPFALAKVAGPNNYISRPHPHSAPAVD